MKAKSTIQSANAEDSTNWEFPCLGGHRNDDFVVLFTSPQTGVVVRTSNSVSDEYPLGYHSNFWSMEFFTPLPHGTQIILENE